MPVLAGDCHNYTEQWYYDVYEGRCRPFYYGGCGGNQNRFNSEVECQRRCDQNYVQPETPPVTFTKGIIIIKGIIHLYYNIRTLCIPYIVIKFYYIRLLCINQIFT